MQRQATGRVMIAAAGFVSVLLLAAGTMGQSLFERKPGQENPRQPTNATPANAPESEKQENGTPGAGGDSQPTNTAPSPAEDVDDAARSGEDPDATARAAARQLEGYSLMVVVPPKPITYQKHDLIEIIINETSTLKFEESLETDKSFDMSAALKKFPSLRHLLEFQLEQGDTEPLIEAAANASKKFEGDGELERKDRFTARISAEVIEVKPNGNLVLEARKTIDKDGEASTIVLAGVCRRADVTRSNTVQSSQIAFLTLKIESSGEVRDAAKKGIIPQILDAIFNF